MVATPANDTMPDTSGSYVTRIMRIPLLTLEEEQRLTRLWRDEGDLKARERVINAHLRLTVKTARQFGGYGVAPDDLMEEGAIGLGKAIDKFDPDLGFRFITYANWWVRASVMEYVLRHSRQTPMGSTADSKKLFFSLRREKAKLGILDDGAMTPEEIASIAKSTGTSAAAVVEMERRFQNDASLNVTDPESGRQMMDNLVDDGPLQDEIFSIRQEGDIRLAMLRKALEDFDPRDRHIIEGRRLMEPVMTLEDLAKVYGVSRERIRQLEVKAVQRLDKRIKELARMRRYLPLAA